MTSTATAPSKAGGTAANAPARILGLRRTALLEVGGFLAALLMVDLLFLDGSRFAEIAPHPFGLIVLLVSIQYGTREGIMAAVTAAVALLAGNLPAPALSQGSYDYLLSAATNPLMWFLAALVFGELRMRHIRERESLQRELAEALRREEALTDNLHRLSHAAENLELRVASQMRSVLTAYEAAKAMEKLEPGAVLSGVMEVVARAMNPAGFSLFLLKKNALELSIERGWSEEDSYSRVLYPESSIFREVIARRRILCCAGAEDEQSLAGEGLLAGPLVCADSGEVIGMLKIEKMGFLDLNLSNVEAFRALCDWVGTTYANARRFQAARAGSLVNSETRLYSYGFLERQTDFLAALARRFGFDLSLVILRLENGEHLDEELRHPVPAILNRTVRSELRKTDLVFDYQKTGSEFAFILPGNSVENAQILVDKILGHLKLLVKEARFSATTVSLHRAQSKAGPEVVRELPPIRHEALARMMAF